MFQNSRQSPGVAYIKNAKAPYKMWINIKSSLKEVPNGAFPHEYVNKT